MYTATSDHLHPDAGVYPSDAPFPLPPVLIRIDTKSGHGASNVTKQIEATADIYAFIMYNLGVTPKF